MIQVKSSYFFLILLIFSSLIVSCDSKDPAILNVNNQQEKEKEVYYPFPARFDIDFEKGNKQLSNNVLHIWKGLVSGNMNAYSKYFNDTIYFALNDRRMYGAKDSILNEYLERRKKLDVVQVHIDFWHPVYNKEKDEDWVLIWVSHMGTKPDKTQDAFTIHQVWKFNKQNKIFEMQEYKSLWNW